METWLIMDCMQFIFMLLENVFTHFICGCCCIVLWNIDAPLALLFLKCVMLLQLYSSIFLFNQVLANVVDRDEEREVSEAQLYFIITQTAAVKYIFLGARNCRKEYTTLEDWDLQYIYFTTAWGYNFHAIQTPFRRHSDATLNLSVQQSPSHKTPE